MVALPVAMIVNYSMGWGLKWTSEQCQYSPPEL